MTHTFKHSWYMTLPYHVSPIIYSLNPKYLLTHTSRASSRIMTHYQWLIFMSHKYESSFTSQKKPQMFQNIYGSYITTFPYSSTYSHVKVMWPLWQITWRHHNVTKTHTMSHSRDKFISCPTDDFSFIKPIKLLLTLQSAGCWCCNQLTT